MRRIVSSVVIRASLSVRLTRLPSRVHASTSTALAVVNVERLNAGRLRSDGSGLPFHRQALRRSSVPGSLLALIVVLRAFYLFVQVAVG